MKPCDHPLLARRGGPFIDGRVDPLRRPSTLLSPLLVTAIKQAAPVTSHASTANLCCHDVRLSPALPHPLPLLLPSPFLNPNRRSLQCRGPSMPNPRPLPCPCALLPHPSSPLAFHAPFSSYFMKQAIAAMPYTTFACPLSPQSSPLLPPPSSHLMKQAIAAMSRALTADPSSLTLRLSLLTSYFLPSTPAYSSLPPFLTPIGDRGNFACLQC